MKVGDLVKCEFHGDEIGIIIKQNALGFWVWINDKKIAFFRKQLEVVSEV
tara:strand:+ start:384 stop:533 length:150 start_codon:yes stop_codon:yes gene_type:complete